jgi:hypothetical protein
MNILLYGIMITQVRQFTLRSDVEIDQKIIDIPVHDDLQTVDYNFSPRGSSFLTTLLRSDPLYIKLYVRQHPGVDLS